MVRLANSAVSAATVASGLVRSGAATLVAVALAGCQPTATPTPVPDAVTGQNPGDVKYYPSDEPVKLGIQRFYEGNFGLSQQYFQNAVEKTPRDATAWVGLAASYDRLGRFDLADHSYAAAVKLVGRTPNILNDEGYSYMLRGDLKKARAKFVAALTARPGQRDRDQQSRAAQRELAIRRARGGRGAVRERRLRSVEDASARPRRCKMAFRVSGASVSKAEGSRVTHDGRPTSSARRRGGGAGRRLLGLMGAALIAAGLAFAGPWAGGRAQVVEEAPVRHVTVTLNKSKTLTYKTPFSTAVIGSPEIADLLPMNDHTLYVQGKKVGTTNISVFDADKRLVAVVDLEVALDTAALHSKIAASTGGGGIRVTSANGEVVLSGQASDAVAAARAVDVAKALTPKNAQGQEASVVNAMKVAPSQQVMLKVRFLEVDRTAGRDLGVNFFGGNKNGHRRFRARRGGAVADRQRRHHHRNLSDRDADHRRHRGPDDRRHRPDDHRHQRRGRPVGHRGPPSQRAVRRNGGEHVAVRRGARAT